MKNLENKFLKHYVGYVSERDEYEKSKIYEILGNANILTFYLTFVLMLISLIWDVMHQTISLGTLILVTILEFNINTTLSKFRKYNLQNTEIYDVASLKRVRKLLRKKFVELALNFGLVFTVYSSFVNSSFGTGTDDKMLLIFIISFTTGMIVSLFLYLAESSKLKIIKDDEDEE